MTLIEGTKAFKTKLKMNAQYYPTQYNYLTKVMKACCWVKNWYVRTALEKMKQDGITVFSSKKELQKYSPRELRKELTKLINTDPNYAKLKEIPSVPRTLVFEHIEKTFKGGKGVKYNFIHQCECMAKQIQENIKRKKEECLREGIEFTDEMREEASVFFVKKKPHKPNDLYAVKGFPRYASSIRHQSFRIDNVILDYENKCITLPPSQGNKKFGIPKLEGIKVFFFNHDFNPKGVDKSAIYTVSYDGEDWWMSVKQSYVEAVTSDKRDLVLGIDLGLKTSVYFSNGQTIESISEDTTLKKLNERKKELDRMRKRNLEKSPLEKIETPYGKKIKPKSAKYKKLTKHIQWLDNKILHYKDTLFKQQVAKIPFNRLKGIVLEDFQIELMKKNKRMSGKTQKVCLGKIRELIVKKADQMGIPVMKAEKTFPSTQLCSACGKRNEHMRHNLGERTFKCEFCGHVEDRDLNASKNLAKLWGSDNLVPYKP